MNDEQLQGKWEQMKGKVKQHWGNLTDDDIRIIDGKKDELVGKIIERHGIAKEQAKKDVDNFFDNL